MTPVGYLLLFFPTLALANSNGQCVMRGNCDEDNLTGLKKPCVYNGNPVPLNDANAINTLKDLCPNLKTGPGGEVCCEAGQLELFKDQTSALQSIFQHCPSCYYNLVNLFCQQLCSPNQGLFLEVTGSTSKSVDQLNYYVTEHYTSGLFDSCKNVRLSFTQSRAIEIACGAFSTDCTPHLWLEYMGGHDPSPYQINFHFETSDTVTVKEKVFYPMNETIVPCSEAVNKFGTPCYCADCPSSPLCK